MNQYDDLLDDPDAFRAHKRATAQLVQKQVELQDVLVTERNIKTESWLQSQHKTDQAKSREADFHTLDLTEDVYRLKGEVAALESVREHLRLRIEWGG